MTRIKLFAAVSALCFVLSCCNGRRFGSKQRRAPGRYFERFSPLDSSSLGKRKSIADMMCDFVEQPLNHFELPRGKLGTFQQRYCVNNQYVLDPSNATVFLYTGNESPLEEYINNTGLMWELAEVLHAQVVFIEHRYEGKSLPSPDIPNCMAYSSSIQACADYASFVERHVNSSGPVIAFGGSYGGMLSAWMRMKYPNLIAGAIAGSAPIWGFPKNFPDKIDRAGQVIQRGLEQSFPPTEKKRDDNHCATNLLAAWPLIKYLGREQNGRNLLTESFRLCSPLQEQDVDVLIQWAQSPWFDLAEGSFPYPSSYIPFALTHNDQAVLPAWPLQSACWNYSTLQQDLGIRFHGNTSDVHYDIHYAESVVGSALVLQIDWGNVTRKNSSLPSASKGGMPVVSRLLTNVRDSVSIWYNITNDQPCYKLTPAPNRRRKHNIPEPLQAQRRLYREDNATKDCRTQMAFGSWNALCCNEEMNLIITEARGLGNDFLWPPSHPRGTRTHVDVVNYQERMNQTQDEWCLDPLGHYGFPKEPPDPWSTWLDTVYGGVHIQSHSNIIFSNGLLDPWSAAGVYKTDPTTTRLDDSSTVVPGLYLQHINDRDLIALIMEYGGHHTDLMFSSHKDPPSIQKAREIEKEYIVKWVDEWWENYSALNS